MYDSQTAAFFTEVVFKLGAVISAAYSLQAAVLLASIGWSLSNRASGKPLGGWSIALVALALTLFFVINFQSLNVLYRLLNGALEIPRAYWTGRDIPDTAKAIFRPFGLPPTTASLAAWARDWRPYAVTVDTLAVLAVCLLLSGIGRRER